MRFLCLVLSLCGSMSPLLAKESSFQEGEPCFYETPSYSRHSFSGLFSRVKRYGSFSTQKTYGASSENGSPSEHDKTSEAPRLRKKEGTETRSPSQSMRERFRRSSFRLSSFSLKKKRTPSQTSEDSEDSGFASLTSTSDLSVYSVSSVQNRPLPPTPPVYHNEGRLRSRTIRRILNQEREELFQALAEQPNQEPPQAFPNGYGEYVTRSGRLCTQNGTPLEGPLFFDASQKTWDSPEAYEQWAQEQKEQQKQGPKVAPLSPSRPLSIALNKMTTAFQSSAQNNFSKLQDRLWSLKQQTRFKTHIPSFSERLELDKAKTPQFTVNQTSSISQPSEDETDHRAFPSTLSAAALPSDMKKGLLEEGGYLVPNALAPNNVRDTIEVEDRYLASNVSFPQERTSTLETQNHPYWREEASSSAPVPLSPLSPEAMGLLATDIPFADDDVEEG